MSRTRNAAPSYIPHAKSGRGRLQWYDSTGARREKLLPGPFGSPESLASKARLELELASSPTHEPAAGSESLSVAELLCAYLDFAEKHYRGSDGSPTDEVRHIKAAIRHVRELYAKTPATGFGPLSLKAARQRFVEQKWCRKTVNARIQRVRRIFKWAVAEELAPPSVYQALAAVSGLERGRTDAKESEPVRPVDDAVVDATLPFLTRRGWVGVRSARTVHRAAGRDSQRPAGQRAGVLRVGRYSGPPTARGVEDPRPRRPDLHSGHRRIQRRREKDDRVVRTPPGRHAAGARSGVRPGPRARAGAGHAAPRGAAEAAPVRSVRGELPARHTGHDPLHWDWVRTDARPASARQAY